MQDGVVVIALRGAERVEAVQDVSQVGRVEELLRHEVLLLDEPHEHDARDHTNDLRLYAVDLVFGIGMTRKGYPRSRVNRPEIPSVELRIEILGESFHRERLHEVGKRDVLVLQRSEATHRRVVVVGRIAEDKRVALRRGVFAFEVTDERQSPVMTIIKHHQCRIDEVAEVGLDELAQPYAPMAHRL